MIIATRKFEKNILVHEKYFAKEISWCDVFKIVVYKYPLFHGSIFFKKNKGMTLLIDLKQDLDKIFNGFTKNNRKQIANSVKAGIVCQRIFNVDEYIEFFNEFAIKKCINTITKDRVFSYGLSNFYAFSAILNGRKIVTHSYILDEKSSTVLILTSANIRFEDIEDKQIVGKANKHLHYFEMQTFKEMGISTYDFGGIATENQLKDNPEFKGINDFKLSFGGNVVTNNEYCSYPYLISRFIATQIGIVKINNSLRNRSHHERTIWKVTFQSILSFFKKT